MKGESVKLPNEDFLPFLILYTSTSYKEIMPSAPLKLLLYISTLLLKVRLHAPFIMHLYPTSMVGSTVGKKSNTHVYLYTYRHFILICIGISF